MDTEEIEKLHSLKEKGIITEEQFNQKKQQILGISVATPRNDCKNQGKNVVAVAGGSCLGAYILSFIAAFLFSIAVSYAITIYRPTEIKMAMIDVAQVVVASSDVETYKERKERELQIRFEQLDEEIKKGEIDNGKIEQLKDTLTAEKQAELTQLEKNITEAVDEAARENGVDIVISKSSFVIDSGVMDITSEVKEKVKQ